MSTAKVRIERNDATLHVSYHPDMAKKSPAPQAVDPDWYLQQWMKTLGINQAELGRRTGWSKATVSDIYHGRTNYYRDIVNQIASALHLRAWELLMPPEEANRIKRWRAAFEDEQVRLAAENPDTNIVAISRTPKKQKTG